MVVCPFLIRYSFALLKCLQPKKAPPAKGEGWAASSTRCFVVSIHSFLLLAKFPHNRKTKLFFCDDRCV